MSCESGGDDRRRRPLSRRRRGPAWFPLLGAFAAGAAITPFRSGWSNSSVTRSTRITGPPEPSLDSTAASWPSRLSSSLARYAVRHGGAPASKGRLFGGRGEFALRIRPRCLGRLPRLGQCSRDGCEAGAAGVPLNGSGGPPQRFRGSGSLAVPHGVPIMGPGGGHHQTDWACALIWYGPRELSPEVDVGARKYRLSHSTSPPATWTGEGWGESRAVDQHLEAALFGSGR